MSLLGTIQPFTLEHVFGAVEREAGLLARALLAYPPDRPALWTDEELPDDVVAAWRELLAALLSLEPARDDAGQPRPRFIGLAGDAKEIFISWHDRHARETANLGDDHLRAHWSKLKGACARIALLFSCTEAVGGKNVCAVSLDCIKRAISVTEWLKQESARVYAGLHESDEGRDRRQLVEWTERRGGTVTVRDLTHGLRRFRGDAPSARAALDELAESGVGRWVPSSSGTAGGRPTERFELTRVNGVTVTNTPPGDTMSGGFGDGDGVGGDGAGGEGVSGDGSDTPDAPADQP